MVPPEKAQYLEPLNSVMRLLRDLKHDEMAIRRIIILTNIKSSFEDTLKNQQTDQWLFRKGSRRKIESI